MAKYLLLKHYRGAPAAVNDVPMDQWEPEEVEAHLQYMRDFAARLEGTGEYVDGQARTASTRASCTASSAAAKSAPRRTRIPSTLGVRLRSRASFIDEVIP